MYLSIRESKPGSFLDAPLDGPTAAARFAHACLAAIATSDQEFFFAIPLNVQNQPGLPLLISAGGQAFAAVDAKVLFRRLLDACAAAFNCVHNHPSSSLVPSPEDVALTRKLRSAGELIDIQLMDHIILSPVGHVSLRDGGHI